MAKIEEIPVTSKRAREILEWCPSYMSAVRHAMGLKRRYVFISELKAFIRKNPNFTSSQIYHPSKCKCDACQTKRSKAKMTSMSVPTNQSPDSSPQLQESSQVVTVNCRTTPDGYNRKLLGQMFVSHRRKAGLTAKYVKAKAGVSRETLRKLEKGLLVKLSTVYQIAAAVCMNDRERGEATALWLKDQAGGYADQMRIELDDSVQAEKNSDLKVLVQSFAGMKHDTLKALLELVGHPTGTSIVEQAQPKAAVATESEYKTLIAESPRDDLWALL